MPNRKHFNKPALNIPDQICLLKDRGISISDEELATHYLMFIGYHRLYGYAKSNDGTLETNIDFDSVLDRYIFDRRLRLMIFDSIERIEVALRSVITCVMAEAYGAFWFTNPALFISGIGTRKIDGFARVSKMIREATVDHQNKEDVLQKYYSDYSSPELPPSWLVMESLSLGVVSKILSLLQVEERKKIAKQFKIKEKHLVSWIRSLTYTRNLCAHHSRVWNKVFTVKAIADKSFLACKEPEFSKGKVYSQMVIIAILLNVISPDNHWEKHILELLNSSKSTYAQDMGFPELWNSFRLEQNN